MNLSLAASPAALSPATGAPAARAPAATSRPAWFRRGLALLTLGVLTLTASQVTGPEDWWIHGAWCITAFLLMVPTLRSAFRLGATIVLRDHFVMLAFAFTLYYVFGSSLLAFGPEHEIDSALVFYAIDATDAVRVDAANSIGFGLALIVGSLSSGKWFARQTSRVARAASIVPPGLAIMLFISASAFASANVLSFELGMREGVISGIWRTAARLSLVSIFLAISYRGRAERWLWFGALLVTGLEAAGGLLLFNKSATLLPLAALIAGMSVRLSPRVVMPVGVALIGVLFVAIGSPVAYSRNSFGKDSQEGFDARVEKLEEGLTASGQKAPEASYSPWSRFCYTAPQTAALKLYDQGDGGDELRLVPWLFVPRAIAPHKPIITQVGPEFYTKITGNEGTAVGHGLYTNGYYNGGWLGLLAAALVCGWVLRQTSAMSRAILDERAILLLPLALLGVHMAFRIDAHVVTDYLGPFVFMLYPVLLGSFILKVARRRR